MCPSSSQILATPLHQEVTFSLDPPQCPLASLARVPKVTPPPLRNPRSTSADCLSAISNFRTVQLFNTRRRKTARYRFVYSRAVSTWLVVGVLVWWMMADLREGGGVRAAGRSYRLSFHGVTESVTTCRARLLNHAGLTHDKTFALPLK